MHRGCRANWCASQCCQSGRQRCQNYWWWELCSYKGANPSWCKSRCLRNVLGLYLFSLALDQLVFSFLLPQTTSSSSKNLSTFLTKGQNKHPSITLGNLPTSARYDKKNTAFKHDTERKQMILTWKKQCQGPAELICQWQGGVPAWQWAGWGWRVHFPSTAHVAVPGKWYVVLVTQSVHRSHRAPHLACPYQTRMNFCWPGQIAPVGLCQMVWRQHQGSCIFFWLNCL